MSENPTPDPPSAGSLRDWLWSREFYDLMQTYRHMPALPPQRVVDAFEAVKSAILDAAAVPGSAPQNDMRLHFGKGCG